MTRNDFVLTDEGKQVAKEKTQAAPEQWKNIAKGAHPIVPDAAMLAVNVELVWVY